MAEREQEVLNSVPESHRKRLENIIHQYHDVFPEKLPKGVLANLEVKHQIKVELGSKPPYRPPYRLGSTE